MFAPENHEDREDPDFQIMSMLLKHGEGILRLVATGGQRRKWETIIIFLFQAYPGIEEGMSPVVP